MNVVACDLPGHDLQLMFRGNLPQQVAHAKSYVSCQHRLSIFRNPHHMHLQIAPRVRAQPVKSHATTLHQILLRLKARGFHHPRGGH